MPYHLAMVPYSVAILLYHILLKSKEKYYFLIKKRTLCSHVNKVNGKLECTIILNNTIKCCNEYGSIKIIIKDYLYIKPIKNIRK